jgi:NADH dehydrogenase (ubiquinone) 1 alpha subcomplex subunit 8
MPLSRQLLSKRNEISLEKMRAVCAKEFEAHWQCLDKNNQVRTLSLLVVFNILPHLHVPTYCTCLFEFMCNQEFYPCRKEERPLNACMFTKLVSKPAETVLFIVANIFALQGLTKTIPGVPKGTVPIHEVQNPIYKVQMK